MVENKISKLKRLIGTHKYLLEQTIINKSTKSTSISSRLFNARLNKVMQTKMKDIASQINTLFSGNITTVSWSYSEKVSGIWSETVISTKTFIGTATEVCEYIQLVQSMLRDLNPSTEDHRFSIISCVSVDTNKTILHFKSDGEVQTAEKC